MLHHRRIGLAVLGLAALLAAPLSAAEVDRFLPKDTEVLLSFNFRQLLDSPLLKDKHGAIRDALQNNDQVADVLKDLGLDPLKDIDSLTVAAPGAGDQDQGLMILRGRFNVAKLKARAETEAKNNEEVLKIHKVPDGAGGQFLLYEVNVPNSPQPVFVAVANEKTIVASPGKDYVIDALKTKPGAKPALKSKEFQALLQKIDGKQTLTAVALSKALKKGQAAELPGVKDALDMFEAVAGGITIADDVKLEVGLSTKNADDADTLKKNITDGLNLALAGLALAGKPELAPALDFLKSIKVATKESTVLIRGQIAFEDVQKLINGLQKIIKP
jgi:hypothetical protein